MVEVFDQFDQTLLLLGAPGSGKTTLLLELTRDLIERAKGDPAHPIPVVFNLSSWALKRPPLPEWLVEELNQRYDVPRKIAEAWVESDQVVPLLDGLDEVALEQREACVDAINTFRKDHGLLALIVTSRSIEYEALSQRLRMPGAVTIEPLTREQVERYLKRGGGALSGVQAALREDEPLWELLDTPLMLSILRLAFRGGKEPASVLLAGGVVEERRGRVFDAYIEAMFKRRATKSPYTPQQARHWLSWLATAMTRQDQTVFYLERMQPAWLSKKQETAQRIGSALVVWLIGGLGLASHMFGGPSWAAELIFGLSIGLLVFGGLVEWPGALNKAIQPIDALRWSWPSAYRAMIDGVFVWLSFVLFILLIGNISLSFSKPSPSNLVGSLVFVLLLWLSRWLLRGLVTAQVPIRALPNEGTHRSLKHGIAAFLIAGVFVGSLVGVAVVLFVGSGAAYALGVFDRTIDYMVDTLGLSQITWGQVFVGWNVGVYYGLSSMLFLGSSVGVVVGLFRGGYAAVWHAVLRIFLWHYDYAPLRYVRFLEHAKDLLFLRRVGGGYIFVHRMLLEHFAGLEGVTDGERVG